MRIRDREAPVGIDRGRERVRRTGGGASHRVADLVEAGPLQCVLELVLPLHVLVERRSPNAESLAQPTHGESGRALLLEQGPRCSHDVLPPLSGQ